MSTGIHYKKRHPLTIVFGLLVIAFYVLSCASVIYTVLDGACSGLEALVSMTYGYFPAFIALGMARFLSHAHANEAWTYFSCLFAVIVLFISSATVSMLGTAFFPQEIENHSLVLHGTIIFAYIVVPAFMTLCVIVLLRLPRLIVQFVNFIRQTPQPPQQRTLIQFVRQNWKKDIAVAALFYVVLTASAFTMFALNPPLIFEEHLDYKNFPFKFKKEFPAEGSDFAYWRGYESFQCEFTISEEGFLHWASTQADWKIETIPLDKPYSYHRFLRDQDASIEIADGLFADFDHDGDFPVFGKVVFDRKMNRGYWGYVY